jgi:hypothetical protein
MHRAFYIFFLHIANQHPSKSWLDVAFDSAPIDSKCTGLLHFLSIGNKPGVCIGEIIVAEGRDGHRAFRIQLGATLFDDGTFALRYGPEKPLGLSAGLVERETAKLVERIPSFLVGNGARILNEKGRRTIWLDSQAASTRIIIPQSNFFFCGRDYRIDLSIG